MPVTGRGEESSAAVILHVFTRAGKGEVLTAADLMERSGLTRKTVLQKCQELLERGWIVDAPPPPPQEGSPGRRPFAFAFNRTRRYVVGADMSLRTVTAVVTDLTGVVLGRASRNFDEMVFTTDRAGQLEGAVLEALSQAGVELADVESICVGVSAPVDTSGTMFSGDQFWELLQIESITRSGQLLGRPARIENDANLAAQAELAAGTVEPGSTFVTLFVGDMLGAGLMCEGHLFRGANGSAGELGYLDRVEGVGSAWGFARAARHLVHRALSEGRESTLRAGWSRTPKRPTADEIFAAARAGDALAQEVVVQLGERYAVAISTAVIFLDPSAVVIAGGMIEAADQVIDAIRANLTRLVMRPLRLIASELGRDVVLIGAVQSALERVFEDALTE